MIKKKLIFLVAILAVVLLVGATSCTAGDMKTLSGILQKVDSLSGNVTVTLSDNTTATFNLKDVDLQTLRKTLGNASLEPGDNVTIKACRNSDVKELKARYADIQGTIKSLGTDNITITANNVTTTANNVTITTTKGDITLLVTPKTMILGWGIKKPVFTDLKVGQRVVVRYDVSTLLALTITVNSDGKIQDNHSNSANIGKNQNIQKFQWKMGHKN
jgi:hypothetical protein